MPRSMSYTNILLLLLVYNQKTASGEDAVEASLGDDVLLTCIYTDVLPPSVSVFWRDKDDDIVLDIQANEEDLKTQNHKFKGRVFGEKKFYKTGNFSVQLKDVRLSDAGLYECHIPVVDFQQKVLLTVSGERVEAPPPSAAPTSGSGPVTPVFSSGVFFLLVSLSRVAV